MHETAVGANDREISASGNVPGALLLVDRQPRQTNTMIVLRRKIERLAQRDRTRRRGLSLLPENDCGANAQENRDQRNSDGHGLLLARRSRKFCGNRRSVAT